MHLSGPKLEIKSLDYFMSNYLNKHYEKMKKKNNSFSLRSFSDLVKVDASSLSKYMQGKRSIPEKLLLSIITHLEKNDDSVKKIIKQISKLKKSNSIDAKQLSGKNYESVSSWWDIVILNIASLENVCCSKEKLVHLLKLEGSIVEKSISNLESLGLIINTDAGYKTTISDISFLIQNLYTDSNQSLQNNIIDLAKNSISENEQQLNKASSIFMAIDPEHLPDALMLIKEFRNRMSDFLEAGDQSRVFCLAIQLFPVSDEII